MRSVRRKGAWLGAATLIAIGGAGIGALASSLTSASVQWRPAARYATTDPMPDQPIDHGQAGRSWARVAFDGGLRQCPEMNPAFVAACQSEMKALAAKPQLPAGSYGGPLLITTVEPADAPDPALYRPEPEPETLPAAYEAPAADMPDDMEPTPDNYPAMPLRN